MEEKEPLNLRTDIQNWIKNYHANNLLQPVSDIYVFTDGSGTIYEKPCGWCTVIYFYHLEQIAIIKGNCSNGTNNLAELLPIFHSLWYIQSSLHDRGGFVIGWRIHFISDSELIVNQGKGCYSKSNCHPNTALWTAIEFLRTVQDWEFNWTHVKRNSNPANELCDKIAGEMRKLCTV